MEAFHVTDAHVQAILNAYGIEDELRSVDTLLRYRYEEQEEPTDEVRLILKAALQHHGPVVVKFLREREYSPAVMEAQSDFSEHLRRNGVPTARRYLSGNRFVTLWTLCGREVQVTAEAFVPGEITLVGEETAYRIGVMHARAHKISRQDDCHLDAPVLFDPLGRNDLFSFEHLRSLLPRMGEGQQTVTREILRLCGEHLAALTPLKSRPRYAVQGDLSDCNLYQLPDGDIGMFDFNNCGDVELLCDTVMQGIFVARLMDYAEPVTEEFTLGLLRAFLRGYQTVLPLTEEDRNFARHIDALCGALWSGDLAYGESSLAALLDAGEESKADALLADLLRKARWQRDLF